MAQSHRENRDFPLAEAPRLKAEGLSNHGIAETLGRSEPTVRRKLEDRRIEGEPGAPGGTHKRGFVMADDVWEAIHSYVGAHRRQISEVVDQALREFFALEGWPGQEVRRDG
jgi:IS30 family transposase